MARVRVRCRSVPAGHGSARRRGHEAVPPGVRAHHVARVLPDRYENQAEHRAVRRGQQRRGRIGGRFGDGIDEGTVEHELPHVAQHDAADEFGMEEARAEEVLPLDALVTMRPTGRGDDVDEYDRNDG